MSDDLEDLLRRAMKTLDDQVPPGYFDEFSRQALARLEDPTLHAEPIEGQGASEAGDPIAAASSADALPRAAVVAASPPPSAPAAAEPAPPKKPRDEDSGLHDIRSLASSQRMRISSKRASQAPISAHEDPLASASGSWRAVALPEPAKMVSLPELSELLPAREIKEAEAAAGREARESRPKLAEPAAATATASKAEPAKASKAEAAAAKAAKAKPAAAAAVEQPGATPIAAAKPRPAPTGKRTGARNALIAAAGLVVAAAAGVVMVLSTGKSKAPDGEPAASAERRPSAPLPELRQVAPATATIAEDVAPASGSAAAAVAPPVEPTTDKGKAPPIEKPGKSVGKYVPNVVEEPAPADPARKKDEPKKKPDPGDPDFDKLLKEAGYQEKKGEAPKLEKKSLSGDDIKKGMNAVAAKAAACYAGQQGTASVKLTVAPTGQIQKVTVSGVFAGTPVGTCVEAAVQGAVFPAWDGGPQSVNYSYLLAE